MTQIAAAREIVEYWLGESVVSPEKARGRHDVWYRGGESLDKEIRERFGERVEHAIAGAVNDWVQDAAGALALVILLDQFTRNLFRGTPRAYAGDPLALDAAERATGLGLDKTLPVPGRIFLYHPFHHAETLDAQDRGVALLETLEHEAPAEWKAYVERSIEGFGRHRDVVARFGRFPHRNRVLGRESTAEEHRFLETDPETYGQSPRSVSG